MAACRPMASACLGAGGTDRRNLYVSVMSWAPAVLAVGTQECQHWLHKLAAVLQGRSVVRLKGGCPSVFSRCGSELRALAAAGCAVELVPGVSSALAAPLSAGMPPATCLYTEYSPCSQPPAMLLRPSAQSAVKRC